ncbi:MAG: hypothetical protein NZ781_11080, partial [Armatimonadetes bacterium]|nr:hypothetical protein [Armatimonadota bacterium]
KIVAKIVTKIVTKIGRARLLPSQKSNGINSEKWVSEWMTKRAIILGILLMILNAFWQTEVEFIRYSDSPTIPSLFFNCVGWLALLILLNKVFAKISAKLCLSRSELLMIYAMVCISSQQLSHDWLQILFSAIIYVYRFADPVNRWDELIHPHLPPWLFVSDKAVLRAICEGGSSLYQPANLHAWLVPVFWWSLFTFMISIGMLCFIALMRRQWDFERLTYPIAEIPLEMTKQGFWSQGKMWVGFAIGAIVRIVNQLHYLYPSIPLIPVNIRYYYARIRPWSAWGGFPVSFFPFAVGLSFLMPLDLSFSCWFFYLFTRMQLVIADALGRYRPGRFPYLMQQCSGGYIGLGLLTIWMARHWLCKVILEAFRKFMPKIGEKIADDSGELMPYSVAIIVVLISAIFSVSFSVFAGMSIRIAFPYFLSLFLIIIAVTRIRAEMGLPTNELFRAGADDILARVLGTQRISPRDLAMMATFSWLMRTHRQFPMQTQADMVQIARKIGIPMRRFSLVLVLTTALGIIMAWWALLHVTFRIGLQSAKVQGPALWSFGPEPWTRLQSWLTMPTQSDMGAACAYLFGMGFVFLLNILRHQLVWFPFHPGGYIVSGAFAVPRHWVAIFATWLIKAAVLRYGGAKAYRTVLPFFIGLVVGEFVVGFIRTLVGLLLGWSMPRESGIGGL